MIGDVNLFFNRSPDDPDGEEVEAEVMLAGASSTQSGKKFFFRIYLREEIQGQGSGYGSTAAFVLLRSDDSIGFRRQICRKNKHT